MTGKGKNVYLGVGQLKSEKWVTSTFRADSVADARKIFKELYPSLKKIDWISFQFRYPALFAEERRATKALMHKIRRKITRRNKKVKKVK